MWPQLTGPSPRKALRAPMTAPEKPSSVRERLFISQLMKFGSIGLLAHVATVAITS